MQKTNTITVLLFIQNNLLLWKLAYLDTGYRLPVWFSTWISRRFCLAVVQQHSRQERMISCSRLLQLWRSHKLNLTSEQNELNRSALKMWSVQWQIYWLYNLVLIKMEPNWADIWIYEHERPYSKSIHSLSPSGIWIFDKLVLKFPTAWAKKPLKCPIIGPFLEKINRFGHRDRRFLSGLGSIYRGFQREADGFRTGGEFMIIIYQLPGLASRQDQV